MSDSQNEVLNIAALKASLKQFAVDREWEQFHSPKNLSMALSVEASELLEIFQWMKEEDSWDISDPKLIEAVGDEVADIFVYLLRLATVLNLDLKELVDQKMLKNGKKYPVAKARGNSKKYTEFSD
ncbi:MAG: nucleotide pyrophosphohydrolase [Halobacteriovoraceae bacterium]|jgi:dCTP diphosphatase|nr:nucleotide pyrophosphohydrolase [Halobacteriovoraceae bacterium]MBT5094125.1 nucleotide pyrophosphohydrolase [Halobacteriovoraceae bacterium]